MCEESWQDAFEAEFGRPPTRDEVAEVEEFPVAIFDCQGCGRSHGEPGCD